MAPVSDLPTTSYAVLGMLSVRSWTGYELTNQIQRSLMFCWPKVESVIYEEPRRLTKLGLAKAVKETVNGRRRTRYSITAAGRRALRDWLASPSAEPRIEHEGMLRLLYADQDGEQGLDHLLEVVAALRLWAQRRLSIGVPVVADYLIDDGPFPERNHLIVLFGWYFAYLYEATIRWCDMAEAEIRTWPSTEGVGMTESMRDLADQMAAQFGPMIAELAANNP